MQCTRHVGLLVRDFHERACVQLQVQFVAPLDRRVGFGSTQARGEPEFGQ